MSTVKNTIGIGVAAIALLGGLSLLDPTGSRDEAAPTAAAQQGSPSAEASTTVDAPPTRTSEQVAAADGPAAQAIAQLNALPVKGRAPKTGYSRAKFGASWSDDVNVQYGHNGCDTRNDILKRDLVDTTFKKGTRDCVVLTGTLRSDPYTGKAITFVRGKKTSAAIQIDHIVALSDSWQKGAQKLSLEERTKFANDPLNLIAVDGPANQQKSDGDSATWQPANKAFRCTYATRQVQVKTKYRLWVTVAEKQALATNLATCR